MPPGASALLFCRPRKMCMADTGSLHCDGGEVTSGNVWEKLEVVMKFSRGITWRKGMSHWHHVGMPWVCGCSPHHCCLCYCWYFTLKDFHLVK